MHIYPWESDPSQLSIDALNTTAPNMVDLLADLLPSWVEMLWILLHQTWQIYCQIYPHSQLSIDALHTTSPSWADLMADLPPSQLTTDALHTATPNLTYLLADVPPSQLRIDALHTTTQNLTYLLVFDHHHFQLLSLCNWPSACS